MSSLSTKRKKMESLIYNVFDRLDPSGLNTKKYKSFFSKMSDKEFGSFFDNFFKNPHSYLTLDIVTYEHEVQMADIKNTAKFMNVPLFEYVMEPHISDDPNNPVSTMYPVPVGYIHEKRVQQMVRKKTGVSLNISRRDSKSGQVIDEDKNARISIDESFSLLTYGAKYAAKEFLSARSDDMVMKEEMYNRIRKNGFVELKTLSDKVENKTALNTLEMYLICMGMKTDLIKEGELLPKTIERDL